MKKVLAILGIAITIVGIPMAAFTYVNQHKDYLADLSRVRGLDSETSSVATGSCNGVFRGASLERVVVVGQSFELTERFKTNEGTCQLTAEVRASAFDISPQAPRDIAASTTETTFVWNLTPKYPGDQTLTLVNNLATIHFGLAVKDSKLVPEWASLLGGLLALLLGPALTIPYWLDRRDKAAQGTNRGGAPGAP